MKSFIAIWLLALSSCNASAGGRSVPQGEQSSLESQPHLNVARTGSVCATQAPMLPDAFAPAAGEPDSTAIGKDDPAIAAWAVSVLDVDFGEHVSEQWKAPERALGPAEGNSNEVVSLGEGGVITLGFAAPIADGADADICVFENSFSDDFLELAFVEVASNSEVFVRFATHSKVATKVDAYGTIDAGRIHGFAGKYRQGYCTPFDLADLRDRPEVISGALDLSSVEYVRIKDIVGDGRESDCSSSPIYDPYPTTGGAGFDLDAIAVLASTE